MSYAKYENYIRIGHKGSKNKDGTYSCSDLQNFPTPSNFPRQLHDTDKGPFTDLKGYTHRNRVRHDVEDIELVYNVLDDDDEAYILNRISPEWIYVEIFDKKTKKKKVHKMYASDKKWDTFRIYKDENGNWQTEDVAFSFSLVEE